MLKVSAPRKDLLRLLSHSVGVAVKKATLPALSNVLLRGECNRLSVTATDLYSAFSGSCEATVKKAGAIAVDARGLLERVKSLPDGDVELAELANHQVAIKAAATSRRFEVRGLPGDEYPTVEVPTDPKATCVMAGIELAHLLARVAPSVCADESRAALNAVKVEIDGGNMRAVSTDGHRLSLATVVVSSPDADLGLVPGRAVAEIRKLCEAAESDVCVSLAGRSLHVEADGLTFSTKLVDAQFPPYAQVIPEDRPHVARIATGSLADAIRAVALSSSGRTGGVVLLLEKGEAVITASDPECGEGEDVVACDYDGPKVKVGASAKYLLDALSGLGCDEATLDVGGDLDPIKVTGSGSTFVGVVMPCRLG